MSRTVRPAHRMGTEQDIRNRCIICMVATAAFFLLTAEGPNAPSRDINGHGCVCLCVCLSVSDSVSSGLQPPSPMRESPGRPIWSLCLSKRQVAPDRVNIGAGHLFHPIPSMPDLTGMGEGGGQV